MHAGLLADTANPAHEAQLAELGIEPFQLVVVNLYPFEATVASGASPEQCVEQIDIGGPAMVRAAAKNHGSVAVVIKPSRYADVLAALAEGGFTPGPAPPAGRPRRSRTPPPTISPSRPGSRPGTPRTRSPGTAAGPRWRAPCGGGPTCSATARTRTSARPCTKTFPPNGLGLARPAAGAGIAAAELLHGKAMSYNNYVDADAARRAAYDFAEPCVAIIKHSNPCGIAIGADLAEAHAKANACDPASAFGGVIAANGPVTADLARQIAEVFTEVVIAPGFDAEALDILSAAKNVRLLRLPGGATPRNPPLLGGSSPQTPQGGIKPPGTRAGLLAAMEWRQVTGGILLQSVDRVDQPGDDPANWQLKAGPAATPEQLADLAFAWKACRSVKSNAILLASGGASVGVGMGQVNRVDSSRLAVMRAGDRAAGSVAASDAYFPFADGFEILVQAGVAAVVEPGGSIRDHLTIAAAEAAGIPLYFTGVRHFYH